MIESSGSFFLSRQTNVKLRFEIAGRTCRTRFARTGFVHRQRTTHVFLAMQRINRCLCFRIIGHLNKTKTLAAASLAVRDSSCAVNFAKLFEELSENSIVNAIAQISHIQILCHLNILQRNGVSHFVNTFRTRFRKERPEPLKGKMGSTPKYIRISTPICNLN